MNKRITPKKLTIVSGITLILLIVLTAVLVKVSGSSPKFEIPSRVSVYNPESSEIFTLSYEDFLCGCVAGLLPKSDSTFNAEAIRAVAVAENSRALHTLSTRTSTFTALSPRVESANFGADFVLGEDFPYISDEVSKTLRTAVQSAITHTLTYENQPINAPMCKISTGRTDACLPFSPSIALTCDIDTDGYSSRFAFSQNEVRTLLNRDQSLPYDGGEWFHDAVYGDNGTLLYIDFGSTRYSGTELRKLLSLRSTAISVEFTEDKFFFSCKGFGDNRGMSIAAANYLAKTGKTAEEILAVFYPECTLE